MGPVPARSLARARLQKSEPSRQGTISEGKRRCKEEAIASGTSAQGAWLKLSGSCGYFHPTDARERGQKGEKTGRIDDTKIKFSDMGRRNVGEPTGRQVKRRKKRIRRLCGLWTWKAMFV